VQTSAPSPWLVEYSPSSRRPPSQNPREERGLGQIARDVDPHSQIAKVAKAFGQTEHQDPTFASFCSNFLCLLQWSPACNELFGSPKTKGPRLHTRKRREELEQKVAKEAKVQKHHARRLPQEGFPEGVSAGASHRPKLRRFWLRLRRAVFFRVLRVRFLALSWRDFNQNNLPILE
jgi:hypothetical protein